MKKIMISMAFAATLFVSCHNENLETSSSADNGIVTNKASVYKISELPVIPDFAKSIEKVGELRNFTLIKNDGEKLNFQLTSVEATLFGKMRTLVGTVSTDQKKNEKAVLLVGENGFELLYTDHDQNFILKGNKELSIGYKKPDFNNNFVKKSLLDRAQKKGIDGIQILNSLNNKNIDNDFRYEVAVEKSNNYTLINETATMRKREIKEGKGKCPTAQLPLNLSKQFSNKSVEADPSNYNVEIMCQEDGYEFTKAYLGLALSLYTVDMDTANLAHFPNVSQYPIPNLQTDTDKFFEYIFAFFKQSNSGVQLDNLRNYCAKYPSQKNVARCALYNDGWADNILGLAWVGTYSSSSYSTFIACDNSDNVFAHECGHNLGANHVENSDDVMYKYASSKLPHLDPTNISKIKAKL